MTRRNDENRGPARSNEARPARSGPPKYAGLQRPITRSAGNPAAVSFPGRIRVIRVEAVTMTAAEYDDAVEALAVLIARYQDDYPDHADP